MSGSAGSAFTDRVDFFFLSIFEIEIGYVATLAQHISLSPRQPNED